ncbi:MBL fold metallo-hydrolase [Bacillus canaveralius]|uniref:MBL fold metallo-hydrolase n=1 Tax=Bacillus canaveralius TaxID=1403243 RepID=A0A2N5GG58_9BACI|nr:MBL fold metallo-hydrolase [Bacillus canaveralius]PLR79749.1 MBL fold metallo-hydrolase [Bacillus canaveralius]PLR93159.1 MBL fold metallo-hydrolase [Bacillus canaveralius]
MYKKYVLALLTTFTFLFITGCSAENSNTDHPGTFENADPTENVGTDRISKREQVETEAAQSASSANNSGLLAVELPELKVHYIDVGQADSTLLQFSDGSEDYTILIDAGNFNRTDVIHYLKSLGVNQIDIAIGTHPDADHIGQLDDVVTGFKVGEVWLSGNTSTSETYQRLLAAIDSSGADYYEPRMGDQFEIGPLNVEVLYPKTITGKTNEESISLRLTYGEVRFVFTGDAAVENEQEMLSSGMDLSADILHLGHHGSSTSTSAAFVDAVNPKLAIYSAGDDNPYGHPHEEVVNLLKNAGIQLYGTDIHGTIVVSTTGTDYKINTKKAGIVTESTDSGANPATETAASNSNCVDINKAAPGQLQEIIHIGPARAVELQSLRPFNSVDDLRNINGIGASRIADIKKQGLACTGG